MSMRHSRVECVRGNNCKIIKENLFNCEELLNKGQFAAKFNKKRSISMKKFISELYPNIKDCYTINELGEIKNENTGNIIKHKLERNGYVRVSLMKK